MLRPVLKQVILVLSALCCFLWAAWWTAFPLRSDRERKPQGVHPGVSYRAITDPVGPWTIHLLQVDLRMPGLRVTTAVAQNRISGREKVSSIVARTDVPRGFVVAAINGDYFNPATGEVQNNQLAAGEFVKAFVSQGVRAEFVDIPNSQFALTTDGRPLIDQFMFEGAALWPDGSLTRLEGVNIVPRRGGLTLFNRFIGGASPRALPADSALHVPLLFLRRAGDTLMCRVAGPPADRGEIPIDRRRLVLGGYRTGRAPLRRTAAEGDTIRLLLSIVPRYGPIRELIGGWPRLVRNGRSVFASEDFPENAALPVFARRHPRTGVGFSQDSTVLFFVTVDGRQASSAGMSLPEFADLMVSLGIYQGLNLDGGGSTTMVIRRSVVNSPSDPTGERPVGSCLLLVASADSTRS